MRSAVSLLILIIGQVCGDPSPSPTGPPTPTPSPAPAPSPTPNVTIPDYVFHQFQTTKFYPRARSGAILVPSGDQHTAILVGGSAQNAWSFNFKTSNWTQLLQNLPYPINGACSAAYEGHVYIFGGSSTDKNYTALLELETPSNFKLLNEKPDLNVPSKGLSCARENKKNGHFYVFGGECTNQLFEWDSKTWKAIETKGDNPGPRNGATLLYESGTLILYGGDCSGKEDAVFRLNLTTLEWKKDPVVGGPAASLKFHSAYLDNSAQNLSMVVFGGETDTDLSNQIWSYDLHNPTWAELKPQDAPKGRSHAATTELRGRFLIFGGKGINQDLSDFWQFVNEENCFSRGNDCEKCGATTGCGWCDTNPKQYKCVSGYGVSAYINGTCNDTFTTDVLQCPEQEFPGWAVALIIAGMILAVGTLWYVVMRTQSKEGYERVVN